MRTLLTAILLAATTMADAQPLAGSFQRFSFPSPTNAGARWENRDTTGRIGFWGLLPTADGDTIAMFTSRSRADIFTSQPLYINGTLWPPSGGGSSVWELSGSKAYYDGGFVGIGIDNPPSPLSVQTQDNDQNTSGVLIRNLAGTFSLDFRNDRFLALSGLQPEYILDASTGDPTGAAITFKRSGLSRGQIIQYTDGLQISTLGTGILTLAAPTAQIQNGNLQVTNTVSGLDLFGVRSVDRRVFVGPVPQGETSFGVQNSAPSHRVGIFARLNGTYATPSVLGSQDMIGVLVENNSLANPGKANVGLSAIVGNTGANGTAVPLRLYDGVNRTGQWLRNSDNQGNHTWYVRTRGQYATLVNNTPSGRFSLTTAGAGTYVAFLDSAGAGDFDVGAEDLVGFTHDGSGMLTYTAPSGWANQRHLCTADLVISVGANGTFDFGVRVSGTINNRTRMVKTIATGDGAQPMRTSFIVPLSSSTTLEPVISATSASRPINVSAFKMICTCIE